MNYMKGTEMWMGGVNGLGGGGGQYLQDHHSVYDHEDFLTGDLDDNDLDGGKDTVKRKSRNMNEKKRRDQFNTLINELCAMVTTSNRKMDKTTILKTAITYLKNYKEVSEQSQIHEIPVTWKPGFLSNDEFSQIMLESLECFLMVLTQNGTILYVSDNVVSLLGYLPSEMINKSLFDFQFSEDRDNVYNILQSFDAAKSPTGGLEEDTKDLGSREFHFTCQLRCAHPDKSEECYETVECRCTLRPHYHAQVYTSSDQSSVSDGADDQLQVQHCFCCTVRVKPPALYCTRLCVLDETRKEFTAKFSMDWKFFDIDHSGPPVIGYLLFELLGTSGYDYYHPDDLEKVAICHRQLLQNGKSDACYYRFLTKGQQWVWLHSHFYICLNHIVCISNVVNYSDVVSGTDVSSSESTSAPVDCPAEKQQPRSVREAGSTCSSTSTHPSSAPTTNNYNNNWLNAYTTDSQVSPAKSSPRYKSRSGSTNSSDSGEALDGSVYFPFTVGSSTHRTNNSRSPLPKALPIAASFMSNASTVLEEKRKQVQRAILIKQKELELITEQLTKMGKSVTEPTATAETAASASIGDKHGESAHQPGGTSSHVSPTTSLKNDVAHQQQQQQQQQHQQQQQFVSMPTVVSGGLSASSDDLLRIKTQSESDDVVMKQLALVMSAEHSNGNMTHALTDDKSSLLSISTELELMSPQQCQPSDSKGTTDDSLSTGFVFNDLTSYLQLQDTSQHHAETIALQQQTYQLQLQQQTQQQHQQQTQQQHQQQTQQQQQQQTQQQQQQQTQQQQQQQQTQQHQIHTHQRQQQQTQQQHQQTRQYADTQQQQQQQMHQQQQQQKLSTLQNQHMQHPLQHSAHVQQQHVAFPSPHSSMYAQQQAGDAIIVDDPADLFAVGAGAKTAASSSAMPDIQTVHSGFSLPNLHDITL